MTYSQFINEVRARVWFADQAAAERAVAATLEVVGERLAAIDSSVVADRLPPELARLVRGRSTDEEFGLQELYDRVCGREEAPLGLSMEHVHVICQVLTEAVDDIARQHLRMRLPDEVAALFEVRPPISRKLRSDAHHLSHAPTGGGGTLASGRPSYSHRPICEAHGQSGSVVASSNPHSDTKLSSSRGTESERQGHTLATGKSGGTHPLNESGRES